MKNLLLLSVLLLLVSCSLQAQDYYEPRPKPLLAETPLVPTRAKAVYMELLGNGLIYSFNYDMRLRKGRNDGPGFRIGISGLRIGGTDTAGTNVRVSLFTIPIMANYVYGRRMVAFEAGAGTTLAFLNLQINKPNALPFNPKVKGPIGAVFNAGLRLQPIKTGIVLRLMYTPMLIRDGFYHWIGGSFGVGFK